MSRINREVLKIIQNELNNMKWNAENLEGVIFIPVITISKIQISATQNYCLKDKQC